MTKGKNESKKISSPCIKVCTLNKDEMCIGCGRYKNEIKKWKVSLSDEEKIKIIKELPKRLEKLEDS